MKNRLFAALAAVSVIFLSTAAVAEDKRSGVYISLSGLYAFPNSSDVSGSESGHTANSEFSLNSGLGGLAAIGYEFSSGFRAEIEAGYRRFGFDKANGLDVSGPTVNFSTDGSADLNGSVSTWSFMANGIYSFQTWKLRPYLGAGIGLALHTAKLTDFSVTGGGQTFTVGIDGSETDTVFAYQAMAGLEYSLTRRLDVRVGYRYFGTTGARFDNIKASYGTHNVEAGLVFRF